MAAFFTKGIGSSGGHGEKAGGFISKRLYEEQYKELEQFFYEKMKEYVHSYQVIYAKDYQIDTSGMVRYKKKKLPLGYVVLTDMYPEGTPIIVRTLEGDLEIQIIDAGGKGAILCRLRLTVQPVFFEDSS